MVFPPWDIEVLPMGSAGGFPVTLQGTSKQVSPEELNIAFSWVSSEY